MKEMNHKSGHVGLHQLHGAMSGHPAGLVFVASMWGVVKVVHAFSKPWSCKCGHNFGD